MTETKRYVIFNILTEDNPIANQMVQQRFLLRELNIAFISTK